MRVRIEVSDGQFFHLDKHLVAHVLKGLSGDFDEDVVVKIMKSRADDVHSRHNADYAAEVLNGDFRRPFDDVGIRRNVRAVRVRKRQNVVVDDHRAEHKRTCDIAKHVCNHTDKRADKLTLKRFPISENTFEGLHRVFRPKLVLLRRGIDALFFILTH